MESYVPLPKPNKKMGPLENLRPLILLSTSRKILSKIMMTRLKARIEKQTRQSQVAYRSSRSTTEHVLAVKLVL